MPELRINKSAMCYQDTVHIDTTGLLLRTMGVYATKSPELEHFNAVPLDDRQ